MTEHLLMDERSGVETFQGRTLWDIPQLRSIKVRVEPFV